LFSVGQGAVIPILPLFVLDMGASAATASLVVGMRGIGTMLMDVPGGMLESRFGEKFVMMAGTVIVTIVAIGASFATSPLVLGVMVLFMGGGWSLWLLARLSFVSEAVPIELRGRALSVVGGTNRIGNFVGPLFGGLLGQAFGLESVFYFQAALGVCAAAVMVFAVRGSHKPAAVHTLVPRAGLGRTLVRYRTLFLTAGIAAIALQLLRQARQVFIPLWGESIGLDVAEVGIIFSLSSAIDMSLFYPAGAIMDKWGRKWVAAPSLIALSISLALIPAATDFITLMAVGLLSGFANGLGAGVQMTLGADFAPPNARGEFLGVWRLVGDIGTAGSPILIAVLATAASLGAASVVVAAFGLIGAAVLIKTVPEPLNRPPPLAQKVREGT
jgi:MFS family permease